MLSTPTAERDNRGQEQMDGAQEDLLPDDMEDLSEPDDMSVTEDYSRSDSETEQEPSLQQEPAGSHYPVRNRRPPNILCYDDLGNPSYHPICTLTTPATTASVSVSSPWFPATPHNILAMHNHWVIPYHTPVYLASVPFVPQPFTSMCHQWLFEKTSRLSAGVFLRETKHDTNVLIVQSSPIKFNELKSLMQKNRDLFSDKLLSNLETVQEHCRWSLFIICYLIGR